MEQVLPVGQPLLTLRLTVLLYPFSGVTVTLYVALLPWITVCENGDADKEKSGVVLPQDVNLKDPTRVCQLKLPSDGRYSLV